MIWLRSSDIALLGVLALANLGQHCTNLESLGPDSIEISRGDSHELAILKWSEPDVTPIANDRTHKAGIVIVIDHRSFEVDPTASALKSLAIEHCLVIRNGHTVAAELVDEASLRTIPPIVGSKAPGDTLLASALVAGDVRLRHGEMLHGLCLSTLGALLFNDGGFGQEFNFVVAGSDSRISTLFALRSNSKPIARPRVEFGQLLIDLARRTDLHVSSLAWI